MEFVERGFGPGFATAFRMADRYSADYFSLAIYGPEDFGYLGAVFAGYGFDSTFHTSARISTRFAAMFCAFEGWRCCFPPSALFFFMKEASPQ